MLFVRLEQAVPHLRIVWKKWRNSIRRLGKRGDRTRLVGAVADRQMVGRWVLVRRKPCNSLGFARPMT